MTAKEDRAVLFGTVSVRPQIIAHVFCSDEEKITARRDDAWEFLEGLLKAYAMYFGYFLFPVIVGAAIVDMILTWILK